MIMRRSAWEKLRLEELSHRLHEGMCSRAFDFSFDGFKPHDPKHSRLLLTATFLHASLKKHSTCFGSNDDFEGKCLIVAN